MICFNKKRVSLKIENSESIIFLKFIDYLFGNINSIN